MKASVPEDMLKELVSHSAKVPKDERTIVEDYTHGEHSTITGDILGAWPGQVPAGEIVRPDLKKNVEVLDRLTSTPLSKPITVYSGIDNSVWPDFEQALKTGEPIKYKPFMSSSLDPGTAGAFTANNGGVETILEVTASRGLYVDPISKNSGERELLLPRNGSYKVTGIETRTVEAQSMGKKYTKKVRVVKVTANHGD